MYAVIRIGTSQERVTEGQRLRVAHRPEATGETVTFVPVLLVDGDTVVTGPALQGATVTATVLGEEKGDKVRGLTYKAKSRQRRRWGHRTLYTTVEIKKISAKAKAPARAAAKAKEDA